MGSEARSLDASIAFCYVAFVVSGAYKSAPALAWVPVDLTMILAGMTVALSAVLVATDRFRVTTPAIAISALFGLFAAYAVLSGLWSPSEEYFVSKSIRLIGITGLSLWVGALVIATSTRRLRDAAVATVGAALLTAFEMLYRYLQAGGGELTPFGTNYLITGRVIGLGIVLVVGYLVLSRADKRLTAAALAATAVMSYALLVSGARGPMIAVVGAVGLLVLAGIRLGTLPNGRTALAGYAGAAFVSLIALVTIAQQLRGVRRLLALADGPGRSLGLRFGYWSDTFGALRPRTLLIGEGFGAWPVLITPGEDTQYYPHNIVLEVGFELGAVGLLLLGALLGYTLVNTAQGWIASGDPVHLVFGALFVYMLANVMVTGDLNENRYFFALVGTMAYAARVRHTDPIRLARVLLRHGERVVARKTGTR
jgi:O-antigen ligase